MHACVCCHVQLFAAVACQALSMGFSQYSQEYWSALPCPPPGDLPDPEIEPASPVYSCIADSLPLSHWGIPEKKSKKQNPKLSRRKEMIT